MVSARAQDSGLEDRVFDPLSPQAFLKSSRRCETYHVSGTVFLFIDVRATVNGESGQCMLSSL